MELSGQVLWMLVGGLIGASLASIVFVLLLFTRKGKALPQAEVTKITKEVLPASFRVNDLRISPTQVREGEIVTVSAQVTNTGGTRGSYSATLFLDGRIVATRGVILEADSSIPVTFAVTETVAGKHTVEVDGLKGEFFIPPASFSLSNLSITPSRAKEGEIATVSVKVTNNGGTTGSYLVELKIRGITEMAQEVTLSPNASRTLAFNIIKKKAGIYSVQVGDFMGKIMVEMADQFEEL